MAWNEPKYPVQVVNAAGKALVDAMHSNWEDWSPEEWGSYYAHLGVINNWRSSHAYPLNTFQVNLRLTARRYDANSLVAQRIKRLSSIGHKLDRFPTMKLSQMQDLGGCRAILKDVGVARDVFHYYLQKSAMKHERIGVDDYITSPKPSGYRGVHLVYRYFSDKKKEMYNGLKIEMQLRSRYQHAWATAVETVGTFSGEALKSSLGSDEWQRFFSLMSSVIAHREKTRIIPETPQNRRELHAELAHFSSKLNVIHRLREYSAALKRITGGDGEISEAHLYMLELDPTAGTLKITGFQAHEQEEADKRYSEAEARKSKQGGSDAVLVSVESINSLSKAYPNYFADTRIFVELLSQALSGRSRSIAVPDRQLELLPFAADGNSSFFPSA